MVERLNIDVTPKVLKTKKAFEDFYPEILGELARTAILKDYLKGERIFSAGDSDEKEAYLICGKLRLLSEDGQTLIIKHNDYKAKSALSQIKPRRYTAISESYNTCILWVHNKIHNHLLNKNQKLYNYGIQTEIIPDRRAEQR